MLPKQNHIYKKNMMAFAVHNESDSKLFEDESVQKSDIVDVRLKNSGDRNYLVASINNNEYHLESEVDNAKYLDIWIDGIREKSNISSKLIMFGFGNGMMVRKYLEKMPTEYEIIVYEPLINIFKFVMSNYDISDILYNKRFHLYVDGIGYNRNFVDALSKLIKYQDVNTTIIKVYENYNKIYQDELNEFIRLTTKALQDVVLDTRFVAQNALLMNDNIMHNIIPYSETFSLQGIKDKGIGIPAIVVGAGPSLDKNVEELKKVKGKMFIFATDSAIKTLAKHNIMPDCIFALDPVKDDNYIPENMDKDVVLVTTIHSGWKLINAHKGPYLFTNGLDRFTNKFSVEHNFFVQSIKSGGSVAHVAYSMAEHMGCNPVIFVGMDLAYPGNKSHCDDSVVASVTVEQLSGNIPIKDIDGNNVYTSADMLRYKIWIEDEIKKHPEKVFIDATEGGARIEGTVIKKLFDAVNEYSRGEYNLKEILRSGGLVYEKELKKEFIDYVLQMPIHMRDNLVKVGRIKEIYKEMMALIETNAYKSKYFEKLQVESNSLLDEVENDSLSDITDNFVQNARNILFQNINIVDKPEAESLMETIEIGIKYMDALSDAINEGLLLVEHASIELEEYKQKLACN